MRRKFDDFRFISDALQRFTTSYKKLSDIGHRPFAQRRNHITQKVRIAGRHVVYLTVQDDPNPKEVFLRVKGPEVTTEIIGLDVIARQLSVPRYGAIP